MADTEDPGIDLNDEDFADARRGHLAGMPGGEITDAQGWSRAAGLAGGNRTPGHSRVGTP